MATTYFHNWDVKLLLSPTDQYAKASKFMSVYKMKIPRTSISQSLRFLVSMEFL